MVVAWRPIETAPRDGTPILIFQPNGGCRLGADYRDHYMPPGALQPGEFSYKLDDPRLMFYDDGRWAIGYWRPWGGWGNRNCSEVDPTHWRPLPEPPASTLSALSGEEDQGVRASVSQSGSALHGAPSGSEPSGPITGNAGLFPGVPQPLRSDLQFITAALSTYDGGPASADVHDAWGRITDQLGTEPSATHRNCVGCGAASTLENLVGWTLDQDTRQRWCPACAQPSAAGEP
jgi:hypothetical protein